MIKSSPRFNPQPTRLSWLCLLPFLMATGCGAPVGPWGEVLGVVLQDGKPVEPAVVLFSNRAAGIEYTGETDSEGRFSIRTERINGLPVGKYQVVVVPRPLALPQPEQGMMFVAPAPARSTKIPALDQDLATTRLSAEVQAGSNHFRFDL